MKEDAFNMLWKQVKHKLPWVQLAVHRNRRMKVPDWWRRRRWFRSYLTQHCTFTIFFSSRALITLYGNNLRQLQSPPVICHYTDHDMFTLTDQHHIKEGSLLKMKTGSNASLPVWYSFIHSQQFKCEFWVWDDLRL